MKISYNPSGSALNQGTPATSDIVFDLHSLDIWARGVKIVGNTVTSNLKGLVPNFGTDATGTIDNLANDWVLTKNDDGTVGWYKLPLNAFNNTWYAAMSATEAATGTATTERVITANVLHNKILGMLPSVMTGATASAAGTQGLVPAPAANEHTSFLRGDGTWSVLNTSNITLASYLIATTAEDLADGNTLNQALGKLEYKANSAYNWILGVISEDTDDYINKWGEIVEFINSVKEDTDNDGNPTDILDEFVTRKTDLTITGLKSFSRTLKMIPTTSGTNATGFSYWDSNGDNANTCTSGIGSFFRNGVYLFSYIGWGSSPWDGSTCLKISPTVLTYQNQSVLHSGNYKSILDNTYLQLSGGTLTGPLILNANLYEGNYALDLSNSNIINVNSIIMNDIANNAGEGILFKSTSDGTKHDSIWANSGILYFSPNGTYSSGGSSSGTTFENNYTVLHSGNYLNYTHNKIVSLGYIPAKTLAGNAVYPSGLSTHGIRYVAADLAQEPKYPYSYGCAITAKSYNGAGTGVFLIVGLWNDAQTASNNDVPTGVSVRSRRDNMSDWSTWTHLITNRNIGSQSVNSAKYLLTLQKDSTNFYSDNYEAYLKWESSDTTAFKFNDGTFKFRADLATKADGAYYVFDYNSTTTPIYIGYAGSSLTSSTANFLAAYGTTSAGKRCIKDISATEAKTFIGLKNVQNTAFYKRSTTVNGTAWDMAGTVNSAAFSIYAPTSAGTSGQVLISTAGVPTWTNLSNLSVGKLGTSTVGGTGRPIYLNAGAPTAITVSGTTTTLYIAGVASSTGNIYTGTLSESGVRLVGGNKVYAHLGFYESSDESLKDFYDDIKIDFDKLSKLPKKYFKWKQDQSHLNIGTSAQELQKLYPEIVNTDDDGILHVAYDKLSIIALAAIDELNRKNKELEKRISEFEILLNN